jgi:hypothetical protein
MRDVKHIAVRFPCRFTARKLNDATSASGHARERVSHLTLATLAPVVTTEADFGRVRVTLTEQDKEGRGVRCFHFHNFIIGVKLELRVKFFLALHATVVLDHADVHDVTNVRVTLKRKVIPEVRVTGRVASHAHDFLDDIRTELRVVAHKLCDEDRHIIVTVAEDVSENVSDESRKRGEHGVSFIFHYIRSKLS